MEDHGGHHLDELECFQRAEGPLRQPSPARLRCDDGLGRQLPLFPRRHLYADAGMEHRGGIAYGETPVPDEQRRTPRIPDEDRFWLAFGVGYKISKMFSVDVGYVHIFVDDPKIDKSPVGEDAVRGGLKGTYDANVNIVSAQVVLHF
ncbi:MAG: outer membrane protein transport protein [Desulfomicrobium escambiense]|nr:outer membrane protein transport protein [Desulfomicrobium escambiense]